MSRWSSRNISCSRARCSSVKCRRRVGVSTKKKTSRSRSVYTPGASGLISWVKAPSVFSTSSHRRAEYPGHVSRICSVCSASPQRVQAGKGDFLERNALAPDHSVLLRNWKAVSRVLELRLRTQRRSYASWKACSVGTVTRSASRVR